MKSQSTNAKKKQTIEEEKNEHHSSEKIKHQVHYIQQMIFQIKVNFCASATQY